MPPSHLRIRTRIRYRRRILRNYVLFLILAFAFIFIFHRSHSNRDDDAQATSSIPRLGATVTTTFRLVDDFLDEALHVSTLSNTRHYQDGRLRAGASSTSRSADHASSQRPPRASLPVQQSPLDSDSSTAFRVRVDLDALRAQACHILHGKSILLVGPHETLYQLHSYLLTVLHPDRMPGSSIALTMRPSCPGGASTLSYSCPSHSLCHITKSPTQSSSHSGSSSGSDNNLDLESPTTLADIQSTNSSNNSSSLLRFLNSGNLNPSQTQEDVGPLSVPSIDPRTSVRVINSRWVRYAASSKADILILNRGPLPAPAWSYDKNAHNLTWLTTLRALEREHAEPLSDLFADVLSRLDHHHDHDHLMSIIPSAAQPADMTKLVIDAALHSTISTFLPSLLSTLIRLREHAGHRPILGTKKKIVLWYGSWFLPVSCAPDSLFVFSSEGDDPRRHLAQLLTQAEAMNNPWSAYYNAQGSHNLTNGLHCPSFLLLRAYCPVASVYMHDRLLARLLPTYGIFYISSLSTMASLPEVGLTYHQGDHPFFFFFFLKKITFILTLSAIGERWSCIRRVFETPRGLSMGQNFLRDFINVLGSWNWDI